MNTFIKVTVVAALALSLAGCGVQGGSPFALFGSSEKKQDVKKDAPKPVKDKKAK